MPLPTIKCSSALIPFTSTYFIACSAWLCKCSCKYFFLLCKYLSLPPPWLMHYTLQPVQSLLAPCLNLLPSGFRLLSYGEKFLDIQSIYAPQNIWYRQSVAANGSSSQLFVSELIRNRVWKRITAIGLTGEKAGMGRWVGSQSLWLSKSALGFQLRFFKPPMSSGTMHRLAFSLVNLTPMAVKGFSLISSVKHISSQLFAPLI